MQPGPWSYEGNTVIDAEANQVLFQGVGLVMATIGGRAKGTEGENDAYENTKLIVNAPEMNQLVGEVLDVFNNPHSTDAERVEEMYNIVHALREVYYQDETL